MISFQIVMSLRHIRYYTPLYVMADLKNEEKKGEIASGSNVPFVTSIIEDI